MTNTKPLTARQQKLLDFMHKHFDQNRVYPSIREMMTHMDIGSPNGMACHLKAMEKKGVLVNRGGRQSHCWMPTQRVTCCDCPNCGQEIEIVEELTT